MIYRLIAYGLIVTGIVGTLFLSAGNTPFTEQEVPCITLNELEDQLAHDANITVLDVRTAREVKDKKAPFNTTLNIPLHQLPDRCIELTQFQSKDIIAVCPTGNRSRQAARILRKSGFNATYVEGGIFPMKETYLFE